VTADADGTIHSIGGGGGGGDRITVDLSSQCDGSKLVFTGTFPNSASAMVLLNGAKQRKGLNYTITDSVLTLTTTPPATGSVLEVELF
jgi:hypothetical protein